MTGSQYEGRGRRGPRRGQRGEGRPNGMGNRQNSRKQRLETKFAIPQDSGNPETYEAYATVMTALVEDVRRKDESRDVADSLRDMQLKDITEVKPVREVSIKKDPEDI